MISTPNMFAYKKQKEPILKTPPGTVKYTGEEMDESVTLLHITYDKDSYDSRNLELIEDFIKNKKVEKSDWLIVQGIHNTDIIEKLGKDINLHPLTMEDIANVFERTKIEPFDNYLFAILKEFNFDEQTDELLENQISIILYMTNVITFYQSKTDFFNPIIQRLESNFGRIRKLGADYLFYSLIDIIIDDYFDLLQELGERIDKIEENLMINPTREILFRIQSTKRDIIHIRKAVFPLRDVINKIIRGDAIQITDAIQIYFRDSHDHVIRVIETLESYRDMVSGLLDIYLSSVSNKMNEIMKVLTIIATLFIPLTFVVGVYGMNFQYMPELAWKYGYLMVWILMIIISLGLVYYFRRKKWL